MKNIKDIFEYKDVDYGDEKINWLIFKDEFLKSNKDLVVSIVMDNPEQFAKILSTLYKGKTIRFIENLKNDSDFSNYIELEIGEKDAVEVFYNELAFKYYDYSLFFSEELDFILLMNDDDNLHIVCTKNKLRQVFELEDIFALDSYMYESFEFFRSYKIAILKLYGDYFFSKRITIDDFRLLQPAPEGYWKDGEWILKEYPKKDSSVDNK